MGDDKENTVVYREKMWGVGYGKEQRLSYGDPCFLSPQKNVTLQCVFWVEDAACE